MLYRLQRKAATQVMVFSLLINQLQLVWIMDSIKRMIFLKKVKMCCLLTLATLNSALMSLIFQKHIKRFFIKSILDNWVADN